MPDVLIRGLSAEAIKRLDERAAALGLSRSEYLRRQLDPQPERTTSTTLDDLRRAASATSDLLDPTVMDDAWR